MGPRTCSDGSLVGGAIPRPQHEVRNRFRLLVRGRECKRFLAGGQAAKTKSHNTAISSAVKAYGAAWSLTGAVGAADSCA